MIWSIIFNFRVRTEPFFSVIVRVTVDWMFPDIVRSRLLVHQLYGIRLLRQGDLQ